MPSPSTLEDLEVRLHLLSTNYFYLQNRMVLFDAVVWDKVVFQGNVRSGHADRSRHVIH